MKSDNKNREEKKQTFKVNHLRRSRFYTTRSKNIFEDDEVEQEVIKTATIRKKKNIKTILKDKFTVDDAKNDTLSSHKNGNFLDESFFQKRSSLPISEIFKPPPEIKENKNMNEAENYTMETRTTSESKKGEGNSKSTKVLHEIVSTEEKYCQDIESIISGYMDKMEKSPFQELSGVIFSNIREIYSFHTDFLKELTDNINSLKNFSLLFIKHKDRFINLYGVYCSGYIKAIEVLEEKNSKSNFSSWITDIQKSIDHKLPLATYLLKPVQRILKYSPLFDSLANALEKASIPCDDVRESYNVMNVVANKINSVKKETEDHQKFLYYQGKILNLVNFDSTTCGKYVNEMGVHINNNQFTLVVFERYVIIVTNFEADLYALYALPIRQADFSIDSKREKYIFVELDDEKICIKMKNTKSTKSLVDQVAELKRQIFAILKSNDTEAIEELTGKKVKVIDSNQRMSSEPQAFSPESSKQIRDSLDLLDDNLDELGLLSFPVKKSSLSNDNPSLPQIMSAKSSQSDNLASDSYRSNNPEIVPEVSVEVAELAKPTEEAKPKNSRIKNNERKENIKSNRSEKPRSKPKNKSEKLSIKSSESSSNTCSFNPGDLVDSFTSVSETIIEEIIYDEKSNIISRTLDKLNVANKQKEAKTKQTKIILLKKDKSPKTDEIKSIIEEELIRTSFSANLKVSEKSVHVDYDSTIKKSEESDKKVSSDKDSKDLTFVISSNDKISEPVDSIIVKNPKKNTGSDPSESKMENSRKSKNNGENIVKKSNSTIEPNKKPITSGEPAQKSQSVINSSSKKQPEVKFYIRSLKNFSQLSAVIPIKESYPQKKPPKPLPARPVVHPNNSLFSDSSSTDRKRSELNNSNEEKEKKNDKKGSPKSSTLNKKSLY